MRSIYTRGDKMKKIFITILLVLIPLNAQAINNQKTFSEKQLCKYYKENQVFTDYIIEGENPKEYPFKSNDQIIKEYESDTKPQDKLNRIIKEEIYNNYKKLKKINRIIAYESRCVILIYFYPFLVHN